MCFQIDNDAKCPTIRRAWKVVRLRNRRGFAALERDGGVVTSYHRNYVMWADREVVSIPDGATTFVRHGRDYKRGGYKRTASAGIYVYTSKQAALEAWEYYKNKPTVALMSVDVDPADWLFTSRSGRIATYRKVRVSAPSKQPQLEWVR